MRTPTTLSALFQDRFVREAFERAERDCGPFVVEAAPIAPDLRGGEAVELELVPA